ncbi:MAG: LysM peptidoglycan-binding domain-containing protein [Armatimonadota bacterium]|nr:LysM peptidoglycan-binding domain-containing protein [Armatimonadota bacterium]
MGFTRPALAVVFAICLFAALTASTSASSLTYTVRSGDTLTSIAARFGTTVSAIVQANGLDDAHRLQIGQTLRIPSGTRAARSASAPPAAPTTYTVKAGDTLSAIADRFGVPVPVLVRLNGLADADRLRVGQVLRISDASAGTPPRAPTPSVPAQVHVVQRGDTLWGIARRYGTTPQRLASLNGISESAMLRIGQRLRLPGADAAARPEAPATRRVAAASSRGAALVAMARRFLGTPYRWGATGNGAFDCSGFLYAMFRHMGITLPRTSFAMFGVGRPVPRSQLQPGDLVFFTTYAPGASHAGIYVGGGMFIHASSAGRGVRIDALSKPYYNARFIGARRHF